MTRWEPDARGRLEEAALELFAEGGYERTTVEDIATRAGVTKRTFFRHFADKREVLFAGGTEFQQLFLDGLATADAGAPPHELMAAALHPVAEWIDDHEEHARHRNSVIAPTPALRERELVKLATVAGALGEALRARGLDDLNAGMTAEATVGVFRTAFERWAGSEGVSLGDSVDDALRALRALA